MDDPYEVNVTDPEHRRMRRESGRVDDDRPLVSFLYTLARDHLPTGVIEQLVRDSKEGGRFTNGWAARWAQDVADRLLAEPKEEGECPREGCTGHTFMSGGFPVISCPRIPEDRPVLLHPDTPILVCHLQANAKELRAQTVERIEVRGG